MYILLYLLSLAQYSPLSASQSIQITTGNWVSLNTAPSGSPFNSITDMRVELRIHDWSQSTSGYSHVWRTNNFAIRFVPGQNQLIFTCWPDASGTVTAVLTGRTDFIVRFSREYSTLTLHAEIWDIDGSNYVHTTSIRPSMAPTTLSSEAYEFGDRYSATINCDLAYLRLYNTLVPIGTNPSTTANGNLGDWEFEGNGNDLSGNGMNFNTMTGTMPYVTTPLVPPIISIAGISRLTGGALNGIRADGTANALDATGSYTVNYGATITGCTWNVVSGNPHTQLLANNTNCLASLKVYTAGTHSYLVDVSDSTGEHNTRTITVGATASDGNGIVLGVPSTIAEITGQLLRYSLSPWPWYDIANVANNDVIGPATTPPGAGTALTGTVTLSPCNGCPGEVNPVTITGTGTLFTSELAPGNVIWVEWTTPDQGAGTGRALFTVSTITDDTHLTTASYYHYLPLGSYTNVPAVIAPVLQAWGHGYPNTNNWDFYDAVLAMYRVYYATGNTDYLTYARDLADRWWVYGMDHCYDNGLLWIYKSIAGLILRAEDGQSIWWPNIINHLTLKSTFPSSPVTAGYSIDARERGYELEFDAIAAMLAPDSGNRTTMCNLVVKGVNNLLAPAQQADGSWYSNTYQQNPTYPYGGPGSFPWHMGITVEGLAYAYEAMGSTYCNNSTVQATVLATWKKALDYMYTVGRDSVSRGMYYSTNYYANGQPGIWPNGATTQPGTVSGSSGGTSITGSGSNFTSGTAGYLCNGTDYIGFDSLREVYKVVSCSSATAMTITPALSGNVVASTYQRAPAMPSSCNSSALYCEGNGDRALINTTTGAFGHYYEVTGDSTYLAYGNELFSAAYGGAADGPGGSDPPAGPGADGLTAGNYIDALPPCNTASPPCGGYGISTYNVYSKGWAQGSGSGGASAFLGYSTTASPANTVSIGLSVKIDAVTNAAKVRYTITSPDGTTATTTCTTSPCTVTADARQAGVALVTIEYLDTGNNVLATGIPQAIPIQ